MPPIRSLYCELCICDDVSEWHDFIKVYSPQSVIEHIIVESTKKLQFMANFSFFYFYFVPKKNPLCHSNPHFLWFFSSFNGCFILMGVHSVWRHQQKIRSPTIKRSDGLHLIIKTALFFVSIEQFFITLRSLIWNSNLDLNKSDWESSWKHVSIDAFSVLSWILVNHKFWQYTRTFYLEALMVCSLNK